MLGTKPTFWLVTTGLFGTIVAGVAHWYGGSGPLMQSLLIALGVLFWMDTVLGITCALAIRKEKLQSRKLRRVPLKMMQYSGLITLCFLLDNIYAQVGGHGEHIYLIEIGAVFSIVFHEFTSVLEHLKELEPLTGFRIPEFIGRKIEELAEVIPGGESEEPKS